MAKRLRYIPALDGLRAIAILIVMSSHYGADRFVPGGFGVTLFFFISGYLITSILIQEIEATKTLSISDFYIRRLFRLAPALLFMVGTVTALYSLLIATPCVPQLVAAFLYAMNYYQIAGGATPMPLGVLWSLAVEEHFYLVFPALLVFGWRRPKKFLLGLCLLSLCILVWRLALVSVFHASEYRTFMATDTRLDSILYGAILAVGVLLSKRSIAVTRHWAILFAAGAVLLLTLLYRSAEFRETFRYSLQGIALLPLFFWTIYSEKRSILKRALESAPLVWIGRISYSLYLWHFSILFFFQNVSSEISGAQQLLFAAMASFLMASLSYYLIERPVRLLRSQFSRRFREDTPTSEPISSEAKGSAMVGLD